MDPVVVADMLYNQDSDKEDMIEMLEPLHLEKADLIILPINDNNNRLK